MQLRFTKLNFVFLAMTLPLAPLAMNAQTTSPQQPTAFKTTDIHVGVIGGLAAGNYNLHEADDTGDSENLNASLAGGRVGIQAGVDFNLKGLVIGGVADWSWSNAQFKLDESFNDSSQQDDSYSGGFRTTIKQMTTIRARVGHHYGRVLPYVHGGLLIADTELKGIGDEEITSSNVSSSSVHNGFVVGAGFEYFLARHYSLSTDYGYNHIDRINILNLVNEESELAVATEALHFSTLNVGFNYHF